MQTSWIFHYLQHDSLSCFVSFYIIYLTWSAMSNQPDPNCKLDLVKKVFGSSTATPVKKKDSSNALAMDTASIMGPLVWICGVLYSSIRSITNSQAARITTTDTVNLTDPEASSVFKGEDGPSGKLRKWWSQLLMVSIPSHVCSCHIVLHVGLDRLVCTRQKKGTIETISANMSAVWMKIISSWMCFAIYIRTLIAPMVHQDRDFSI